MRKIVRDRVSEIDKSFAIVLSDVPSPQRVCVCRFLILFKYSRTNGNFVRGGGGGKN